MRYFAMSLLIDESVNVHAELSVPYIYTLSALDSPDNFCAEVMN